MRDQLAAPDPVLSFGLFQKVEAVIPRFCLGDLREALASRGIHHALISRVKGLEKATAGAERYFGNDYLPEFLPRTKIELILPVEIVPAAVKTILRKARIHEAQDRILLSPILRVISINPPHEALREKAASSEEQAGKRAKTAQALA
ncbi:P-II family nitrogen regulator [Methylacidimicrobium tartarophylax]|uniref:Nitrogen regulatory protein P-II 1 n=1 Tax=Methylacidimicrobium tartarophylax TaxID=1041768 RepID=A0A5E6M7D7_9BACT|nr:P-II family nitrogen regulator [Methylacidimicrobium tartarophylax]VVM05226.1 Nitrogen regulatory protein P-II 1 [Methylacidimicrobium tartarophylax]